MSQSAIHAALDADFLAFSAPGMGDLVVQGQIYQPVETTPYIVSQIAAYTQSPTGFGADCVLVEQGSYQVRVQRPANEGAQPAEEIADAVAAYYPRGKSLPLATNRTLQVVIASAQPAQVAGNWISVAVVVSFYSTNP